MNSVSANICSAFLKTQQPADDKESYDFPLFMPEIQKKIVRQVGPLFEALLAYSQVTHPDLIRQLDEAQQNASEDNQLKLFLQPYTKYRNREWNQHTYKYRYLSKPAFSTFNPRLRYPQTIEGADPKVLGGFAIQDFIKIMDYLKRTVKADSTSLPKEFQDLTGDFLRSLINFYNRTPEYPQ